MALRLPRLKIEVLIADDAVHVFLLGARLLQFQHGIFLQFMLDALLQGHDRHLQDFHRLNHAGGQNHSLVEPL